jgi:quinol monooxygenase YgiN
LIILCWKNRSGGAMIKHIVVWKLHDFAEGKTKQENAFRMKEWLQDLKLNIPDIHFLEAGININPADDAFDVVLFSEFDDIAALARYQNHPEHIKFKEKIKNLRSEKKMVDYEV